MVYSVEIFRAPQPSRSGPRRRANARGGWPDDGIYVGQAPPRGYAAGRGFLLIFKCLRPAIRRGRRFAMTEHARGRPFLTRCRRVLRSYLACCLRFRLGGRRSLLDGAAEPRRPHRKIVGTRAKIPLRPLAQKKRR